MSIVSFQAGMQTRATTSSQDPRAQLEVASEQFEALFLQQILKQMRKAGDVLSEGSSMRSRELDTLRDFYDEVLAETLSAQKQTGIADLLVQQLSVAGATTEQLAEAENTARGAELQRSSIVSISAHRNAWQQGVEAFSNAWRHSADSFSALVDSVIKHESSGNVAAVSVKGARGLMQLMPDTAREMASKLGLSFDEQRLTQDGEYNKRLGMAYLGEMLDRYDGHQALALAAYNAGPGNVDKWLHHLGDPRSGRIGVEAWVQRIPFAETRNYTRNILQDLSRQQVSVEPAQQTDLQLQQALERNEQLRAGQLLSQVQGMRGRFNESAANVAMEDQQSSVAPAKLHQTRSAAFAQTVRIDPQGTPS